MPAAVSTILAGLDSRPPVGFYQEPRQHAYASMGDRDLESEQKPWIGDRLEGATELTLPETLVLTEGSAELEMVNKANIGLGNIKQFAKVSGGGRIEMGGTRFVHQVPPMHIYSCSFGDLTELKKEMCVDAPEPYNACFSIAHPVGLLKTIMEHGEVVEIGEHGEVVETKCSVKTIFEPGGHGPVSYDEVSRDIRTGPVIPPSFLKKAPRFAAQREYRLAFDPAVGRLTDRIFIKIPEPEKHFHEVFRNFKA